MEPPDGSGDGYTGTMVCLSALVTTYITYWDEFGGG